MMWGERKCSDVYVTVYEDFEQQNKVSLYRNIDDVIALYMASEIYQNGR